MFWEKYGIEKKDLLVPASVIVGAVLISISIFAVGGSFSGLKTTTGESGQNQVGTGGNGSKVKVAERKGSLSIGTGKVEIIEFSDFQCPYCQRFFNEAYKEIKTKYVDTGKVKITYRHYPLPFHQNAQKSAEAFECAGKQGQAFAYHDILFTKGQADGTGLNVADLKQYAKDLGLDQTKFNTCLDSGETAGIVKADLAEGQKIGVSGTPTFYIDGTPIVGALPFADFESIIKEALK